MFNSWLQRSEGIVDGIRGGVDGDGHGTVAAQDPGAAHSGPRPWLRTVENAAGMIFVLAGLGLVVIYYLGAADGLPDAELGAL